MISRILTFAFCTFFFISPVCCVKANAQESVRKERKLIKKGNSLYDEKKYREAAKLYSDALMENPESVVGRYNLGMSQVRQGLVTDTTRQTQEILASGLDNLNKVAALGSKNSKVASLANFNLGNVAFNKDDYASAIGYYKQALRLNPDDEAARRNLRIAQLKQQNQDKDKDNKNNNKDQNQNKDQNKDQNQNQDQNKDQNKDKDENQNQDKNKNQPPKEKDINPQTADQILKAVENKENQTRNRVMRGQGSSQGKEKAGGRGGRKNW